MKPSFFKTLLRNKLLLLMLLPAVLFFIVFTYIPMAGIIIAFKKFDYQGGVFGSPWCGFENFRFLFIGGNIFEVIRNTALYNLTFIIVNNLVEITLAIFLSEITARVYKKVTQSVIFIPYFVSWVVVGTFVYNLLNYDYGFINSVLKSFNLAPCNFTDKPAAWVITIVIFSLWKSVGYGSILYLAAITGIDKELYEAADIDGANILQRILHITLPSLTPTIIILILLSIGNIFRGDFNMFYQIVGDNSLVYGATDVIDTFVTRSLIQTREFGMTSAAGFIQSILCFAIISLSNFIVRKVDKDYALY